MEKSIPRSPAAIKTTGPACLVHNNFPRPRKLDPTDTAASSGLGGDRDADPARSRVDRRSWLPIPASRYGGTPPQWVGTEECCGGAPVGATLDEACAIGAQPDGWFETPIGGKQGPIAGRASGGVA
ncbi:hypothetical protein NDU88_001117 [Pleurodeles waltl]|uniref:Uncharacterized protein n=1 Tax=Pleurodeles waltl TaxID=8319 RepID=A0AAV7TJ66_PLEWA|nr:hypothetical protein NDU88_001117 [Pleurodeles waltl]